MKEFWCAAYEEFEVERTEKNKGKCVWENWGGVSGGGWRLKKDTDVSSFSWDENQE